MKLQTHELGRECSKSYCLTPLQFRQLLRILLGKNPQKTNHENWGNFQGNQFNIQGSK